MLRKVGELPSFCGLWGVGGWMLGVGGCTWCMMVGGRREGERRGVSKLIVVAHDLVLIMV